MIKVHSHILMQEARGSIYGWDVNECDAYECYMYEHEHKFTYMHINENQRLIP